MSDASVIHAAEPTRGLTSGVVDPLRYDGHAVDPHESSGLICEMVPVGARVLDVGCGTGSMSRLIRDCRQATIQGIEPNPERARAAAERGIDVRVGLLDATTAAELGPFDVVLFGDVLEHVTDPAALLDVAKLALRPGGIVIASSPNVAHWTVRWNLLRGRFDYQPLGIMDATHLRWFTQSTFRSLFAAAGFVIEQYAASAGTWMPEYKSCFPWRWIRPSWRAAMISFGARRWPGLFGCQHVLKATWRG